MSQSSFRSGGQTSGFFFPAVLLTGERTIQRSWFLAAWGRSAVPSTLRLPSLRGLPWPLPSGSSGRYPTMPGDAVCSQSAFSFDWSSTCFLQESFIQSWVRFSWRYCSKHAQTFKASFGWDASCNCVCAYRGVCVCMCVVVRGCLS